MYRKDWIHFWLFPLCQFPRWFPGIFPSCPGRVVLLLDTLWTHGLNIFDMYVSIHCSYYLSCHSDCPLWLLWTASSWLILFDMTLVVFKSFVVILYDKMFQAHLVYFMLQPWSYRFFYPGIPGSFQWGMVIRDQNLSVRILLLHIFANTCIITRFFKNRCEMISRGGLIYVSMIISKFEYFFIFIDYSSINCPYLLPIFLLVCLFLIDLWVPYIIWILILLNYMNYK